MYFTAAHHLFRRVFGSLSQALPALYLFICTIILCEMAWFFFFSKRLKTEQKFHALKQRILVYIFLFYLMLVYIQTGMISAFWHLSTPLINLDRIYLMPFSTSPVATPYLLNILMTIPLGFLLPTIWPKFRSLTKTALTGLLLSFSVESIQLFSNRVTSTSDLLMNTLGAIIGYALFVIFLGWFCEKPRRISNELQESEGRFSSWVVKHEAVIYIFLSLIGVTFLHHPLISMWLF